MSLAQQTARFAVGTQTCDPPSARATATAQTPWEERLRSFAPLLLRARQTPCFALPERIVLFLYSLLMAWSIPHHEAWFDEAQAWLIAKNSTLIDLVLHRLHYEGSPALWHLLLWGEARMGVSFLGMRLIAGAIAAIGVFLWLRYSPLPRLMTLLMPFTFFFAYQYAVVARSYVLAPMFVFALMALYARRNSSPLLFSIVAGLFANCSLHMAAFTAGLSVLYAVDRLWGNRRLTNRWRLAAPAIVLMVLFAASAATAVPTADGSSTTANPLVEKIRSLIPHRGVMAQPRTNLNTLEADAPLLTEPPQPNALGHWIWKDINLKTTAGHHAVIDGRILKHVMVLMTAITAPISTSNLVAFAFLALLCWSLKREKLLLTLLPWALVQVCNFLISGEAHHIGLAWIALTVPLWVLALRPVPNGFSTLLRHTLYGFLFVLVLLQIDWSAHALWSDLREPYASSQETAAFLETVPKSERIAAFDDDSVTVNAYLGYSPYFNQSLEYWPFSRTRDPSLFMAQTMNTHPDMVILKMSIAISPVMDQWVRLVPAGTPFFDEKWLRLLEADGYHETHRFCGERFFRNTAESKDCRVIFERSPQRE